MGAFKIFAVDRVPERLLMARRMGAHEVVDFGKENPVDAAMRLTEGRGLDVATEWPGLQPTFEACPRVLRPGGTLSSLGVCSSDLTIPPDAFNARLGEQTIVAPLCPGGKERTRRLILVIGRGQVDLGAVVAHRFKVDEIEAAYELFASQRDEVLTVAITPWEGVRDRDLGSGRSVRPFRNVRHALRDPARSVRRRIGPRLPAPGRRVTAPA